MTHDQDDRIRELCALQLYGELDEADARELARLRASAPHLDELARGYGAELEHGLGTLRRHATALSELRGESPGELPSEFRGELPAGWRERLRRQVETAPRRSRVPAFLTAAAGFVAGALFVWGAHDSASPTDVAQGLVRETAGEDGVFERYHSEEAPPPATAGGGLDRFASYVR